MCKSTNKISNHQILKEKIKVMSERNNKKKKLSVTITDGDNVQSITGYTEDEKLFDSERFVKIFTHNISEETIYSLSIGAFRALFWIMSNIKKDYDYIEIPLQKMADKISKGHKSFAANAIKELCETGFIAKHKRGVYLINVEWFFNGDRRVLFDD